MKKIRERIMFIITSKSILMCQVGHESEQLEFITMRIYNEYLKS